MPDFSRVLCAVDLTEPSRRALDCALWWARQHGADVSVLHVRHLPPLAHSAGMAGDVTTPAPEPVPVAAPPLTPDQRAEQLLELEAFVHDRRTDGLQVEVMLDEDATVAGAILARADALAADLIVIGAGTDTTSDHPALGRVTAEVLKGAPCSVLMVPPPATGVTNPSVGGIHRIMCAVSLSDASVHALECATSLASQSTAHLTVVHVVELSEVAALAYDFDAHREARLQPACDDLVALVAMVVGGHKPAEEIVAQGTASREILKLAEEESTDLIVVGRGSGARVRAGGRHTGQVVARDARCPVLFVHADAPVLALGRDPLLGKDAEAGATSGT